MRRTVRARITAAAGSAVLLLAACGGGGDEPEVGVPANADEVSGTVVFWTYPLGVIDSVNWWQPHVEEFQEEYPDVEVEVVMQSFSNREEALITAIAGGTPPDVVYFNPDFIPQFADQDLLLPLDDLRDDWDRFYDASLASMTWQDTLYGAPLLMQKGVNMCHTDVMEAAGVDCPTTWEELRAAGPAVKDAGYYLTEYSGTSTLNHSFYQYLWMAGGEVLTEDLSAAAFNGPEGVEALEFIQEMVENEWVPLQPISVAEQFEQSQLAQGNVLYHSGGNLPHVRSVIDPGKIVTTEPLQHREQVAVGSVGAWSIFDTTSSPEAAQAWVHFLSEADFIEQFIAESGYLPPREDIEGLFADDPQVAEGIDHLDYVRTGVMHPKAREIIDVIRPHIQAALLEGQDAQVALDAAAAEVDALIARG